MKKILLATTILGLSAGFAAAQVSFKGTGTVGFGQNGTANGGLSNVAVGKDKDVKGSSVVTADNKLEFYSAFKLSVSAAGETDSGITFGGSSSFLAGTTYNFADDKAFEVGSGALGTPTLFVAGPFGKVQFKTNGFKEFQDDTNEKYDLDYAGTFGGLAIGLRSDLNTVVGNKNYNAATAGKSSISLGYTVSDISLSAAYDELNALWSISASRAFGPVTATLATDDAEVSSLKLAYSADGLSASLKVKTNEDWKIEAGYSANGLTVGANTNQDEEWTLTAAYDLGGGLSVEAGSNYTEDMYVGAKLSF